MGQVHFIKHNRSIFHVAKAPGIIRHDAHELGWNPVGGEDAIAGGVFDIDYQYHRSRLDAPAAMVQRAMDKIKLNTKDAASLTTEIKLEQRG